MRLFVGNGIGPLILASVAVAASTILSHVACMCDVSKDFNRILIFDAATGALKRLAHEMKRLRATWGGTLPPATARVHLAALLDDTTSGCAAEAQALLAHLQPQIFSSLQVLLKIVFYLGAL